MSLKRLSYPLLAVALLAVPSTARPETVFTATMNGFNNGYDNVTATGTAILILSDDQTRLSYDIRYTGLTSAELFAHIHNAPPRKLGPDVYTLPLGSPKLGVWEIPPDLLPELFAGRLYINIHTVLFPVRSEIRGTIWLSVPTEPTTWGGIKALYSADGLSF